MPCSGEIYLGVPITVPTKVASFSSVLSLAKPKSITLIFDSRTSISKKARLSERPGCCRAARSELERETIILDGLISR
ncbi:hypothetical protein ES705_50249 [subsurface metagenome]